MLHSFLKHKIVRNVVQLLGIKGGKETNVNEVL